MDYKRKRGRQYYSELSVDAEGNSVVTTKTRQVVALQWKGPDGQVYRAPDTASGRDSLNRRRWRLLDFTPGEIAEEGA